LVALRGTADKQYGQSLVVGAAGAGRCIRLMDLMSRKMAKAMIKKFRMLLMKTP
jgi:hypothetical protein